MAGSHFKVDLDDRALRVAITRIAGRLSDPSRALRDIGEHMLRSTDQNFRRQRAPDGTPWEQLSDVTLLRRLTGTKKDPRKGLLSQKRTATGGRALTKKGVKALAAAKILRDSGALQDTIRYQLADGGRAVEIGTDRDYGAAQQFGMRRGYAGKTKRGAPIPWGNIPARRFLGLAAGDESAILAILKRHLEES